MCILVLEKHQKCNPEKLSDSRTFNTEKISSYSVYEAKGYRVIELFFINGKWDILCSRHWDDESFSNLLLGLAQESRQRI